MAVIRKLECVFKRVNGDNTGSWTRKKPTKNSVSPGILYMRNCPDGKTFYCDPDDMSGMYYRLIDPETYSINSGGEKVYAWISSSYLQSYNIITINTDPPAPAAPVVVQTPAPAPTPEPPPPEPINAKQVSKVGNIVDFKSGNSNNISKTTSVSSVTVLNMGNSKANSELVTNMTYDTKFLKNLEIVESNLNIAMTGEAVNKIKTNTINNFNLYLTDFPDLQLSKTFSHVFFTRPELNLYNSTGSALLTKVENDPVYYYLDKNNRPLLKTLTKQFSSAHEFNPFLSNMARSFETSDEVVEVIEHGETFTGYKVKYGQHNIRSKTAGSFSISYMDDVDYRIYKIHKAWTDYISKVYRGEFKADDVNIRERILDYACSVYYFICAPDGETILFWSKYTGVFPTNTPSNASSWSNKSSFVKTPEFNINYEYSWKEDFNPLSLAEFNLNSVPVKSGSTVKSASIYEKALSSTGKTFASVPFIQTTKNSAGDYIFKLKYRYLD